MNKSNNTHRYSTHNHSGLFTKTPFLALCEEQVHHDVDDYDDDHELTKLTMRQRRADMAHSDGPCQQTKEQQRGLWAGGQTTHGKSDTGSPMAQPVDQPSQEGDKTRGGSA